MLAQPRRSAVSGWLGPAGLLVLAQPRRSAVSGWLGPAGLLVQRRCQTVRLCPPYQRPAAGGGLNWSGWDGPDGARAGLW